MQRRIAASVGLLGLIGAGWLGVRVHVVGSEPPIAQRAAQTTVTTPVGTLTATVIVQEEPDLLPLEPTAVVPMSVPATGSSFDTLCQRLQPVLKKRFPKCGLELIGHRDGLIINGSAANAQEAATIVAAVQTVVDLNSPEGHPQSAKVANQLEIPGEPQVQLSVKIIEADRNVVNEALRQSLKREQSKSQPEPTTPASPAIAQDSASGIYSKTVVEDATARILKDSKSKTVCEPTLTVVSGRSATFVNGGEFAIPTIVGVGDAKGTTTTFRGFGTTVQVVPTVIDNERLRLALTCESNQVDEASKTAGIPGINARRIKTLVQINAEQSLVMEFPSQPSVESDEIRSVNSGSDAGLTPIAARKKDKPADIERCLFIIVTPKVLKATETNEVFPHPIASPHYVTTAIPYDRHPSTLNPGNGPVMQMQAIPVAPPSLTRDLLLRTPLPATEWSQPTMTPPLPPFDPFGNPIQQLRGWQPMPSVLTPWPSTGPSNVPAKTSRLEHLKSALKHLEAADLAEQVAAIQNEIECEQKSEIRRELRQREQQLDALQRQIESLRRSLSAADEPNPE